MSLFNLEMENDCFMKFQQIIHELTGITIDSNRKTMVQGRLRKRMAKLGCSTFESYLDIVTQTKPEQTEFIDLITTNETYFFRTPRVWSYLNEIFLPQWSQAEGKSLSIWSAAASSGEEAHSLGVLCQSFKDRNPKFDYSILGSDISHEMVQLCKQGRYHGRSIQQFQNQHPEWFKKYMVMKDEKYEAVPEIRKRLNFLQHNLFAELKSSTQFDIILVRNVLIYFTPNDQEIVLKHLTAKLAPNGILVIGESESLSYIKTTLSPLAPLIYGRANESAKKAV